ncbi:hypothetical protein L6164_026243 [Bauhinia variegata]|uniref:Uncharacterized protein n=1 Tax=Bauhinia variegata TaxID=167791 RepID=A0ACB9LPU3_BAUVA|nr:hypothetical protein L6164_026243 [Bauhinia variegata]
MVQPAGLSEENSLANEWKIILARMSQRLETLEERLQKLDRMLANIDERMDWIEAKMIKMEERILVEMRKLFVSEEKQQFEEKTPRNRRVEVMKVREAEIQ